MENYLKQLKNELELRNYSNKTIKSYLFCINNYLKAKNKSIHLVDPNFIREFLLKKKQAGLSSNTINIYLHAIKFFYSDIVKSRHKIDLKFAKTASKLPIVLSREEIKKIIDNIPNSNIKNIKSPLDKL
ncbi:phage integrase N-terminal SAM-like domain-containing protein [Patescibacteria group bacterium]|nr:phage integrase N-terminal SAM-like domain-containing protein [Patescibacteria group bacterium]